MFSRALAFSLIAAAIALGSLWLAAHGASGPVTIGASLGSFVILSAIAGQPRRTLVWLAGAGAGALLATTPGVHELLPMVWTSLCEQGAGVDLDPRFAVVVGAGLIFVPGCGLGLAGPGLRRAPVSGAILLAAWIVPQVSVALLEQTGLSLLAAIGISVVPAPFIIAGLAARASRWPRGSEPPSMPVSVAVVSGLLLGGTVCALALWPEPRDDYGDHFVEFSRGDRTELRRYDTAEFVRYSDGTASLTIRHGGPRPWVGTPRVRFFDLHLRPTEDADRFTVEQGIASIRGVHRPRITHLDEGSVELRETGDGLVVSIDARRRFQGVETDRVTAALEGVSVRP